MFTYTYTYPDTNACIHTYMHRGLYTYIHTDAQMPACPCSHMHTYLHTFNIYILYGLPGTIAHSVESPIEDPGVVSLIPAGSILILDPCLFITEIVWASPQENLTLLNVQQRCRPSCISPQSDQRLCCSLSGKYNT